MAPDQLLAALEQIRYDLSVTQTRVIEAAAVLKALIDANQLAAPAAHRCPECGAVHRGPRSLAEHRYHVHGGDVPEHYLAAERLAGIA